MDSIKALEQIDACLSKIHVSGDDAFLIVNARQTLNTVYKSLKQMEKSDNKED